MTPLVSSLFLILSAVSLGVHAKDEDGSSHPNLDAALDIIKGFAEEITTDPTNRLANWTGNDICSWDGILCAVNPNNELAVAGIDINQCDFAGDSMTLDGLLDKLTDLTFFHANSNGFSGDIPQLDQLPWFYELDLSNNKFTGEFPQTVLGASQLVFLDLRYNQFCGPLPEQLFKMDLDVLYLNNNQFSGPIPDAFEGFSPRYLTLANNQLTGPIPSSFGCASNLLEVLMGGNQLVGPLPENIGSMAQLNVFDVNSNQLTGSIPESYAGITNASVLDFSSNYLTGGVPETLCQLPNLQLLNVSYNYLSDPLGPACQNLLGHGVLDVSGNYV